MTEFPKTTRSKVTVEERFVADVQSYLQEMMDIRGMTRAQLADAMGVSRPRISQIFSGDCTNLTVRLLARAAHALGEEPSITSKTFGIMEERRKEKRQARLIEASENVVPLDGQWTSVPLKSVSSDADASKDDERLDALVQRARMVAGVR